jgi:hypothetical protein
VEREKARTKPSLAADIDSLEDQTARHAYLVYIHTYIYTYIHIYVYIYIHTHDSGKGESEDKA